jgi:hypothetical protein
MASGTALVRPGDRRLVASDHRDAHGFQRAIQDVLAAAPGNRRKVVAAAGQDLEPVVVAADTDQLLDALVVGRVEQSPLREYRYRIFRSVMV